ncbi:MAG: sodium:proline symporter [Bdellovibrionaceae bacterium]|nr:sodium:proline symporter [Pseudobdellovibrionaceae bacterium]|tara:strand:- start:377 stop:2191 length:1815 start_codon:yes stop_codon:yes gene_type:complete
MTATSLDFIVMAVYFIAVLGFGAWFGRYTKSTKDFFFGGQRFSWWLIAMSCVATVVGSYSFMKYSTAGFKYGLSSSMTYLNDWLIMPFFILGWFPIIYFRRVTSIPEYFEKRFDRKTRIVALILILIYMIGYVGINFYTLGIALEPLVGMDLYTIVIGIAVVSAIYMHAGGQTSVIMTDLLQGFVLLAAGLSLLYLGLDALGGVEHAWNGLPFHHRFPLAQFNKPSQFNFVGIFWQDALASSVAFYFMNQGVMMRFMSVKTPRDGTKALFAVVIILMPLASLAIANSGWLGQSMVTYGLLPKDVNPKQIFMEVASRLTQPGVFGLILAALTAALMSTIDTLITAISAIFVNDIWKPFIAPNKEDSHYLKVARMTAIGASIIGVLLVPLFAQEKSIYVAHGKFIATVTPAMVVVILLSVFWKRFTPNAAFITLVGGSLMIGVSVFFPEMIEPIAHGISPEGEYKFMRSFFGMLVALMIGIVVSYLTTPKSDESLKGLVIDFLEEGKWIFKGGKPNDEYPGEKILVTYRSGPSLSLHKKALERLCAEKGDLLYVSDSRWWLGGLKSIHAKIESIHEGNEDEIILSSDLIEEGHLQKSKKLMVEKVI